MLGVATLGLFDAFELSLVENILFLLVVNVFDPSAVINPLKLVSSKKKLFRRRSVPEPNFLTHRPLVLAYCHEKELS